MTRNVVVWALMGSLALFGAGLGLGSWLAPVRTVERVQVTTVDDVASFNDGFLTGHDDCKAFK